MRRETIIPGAFRATNTAMGATLGYLLVTLAILLVMTGKFAAEGKGILYPLDDSYIHLALGRTLAEHGVWGLTADRPSAASSSPLWSVLLAAAALAMPGASRTAFSWVPLIGNIVAGAALVAFWHRRLAHAPWPNWAALVLVAIVPLPTIVSIGMEHVLHTLLASVLAWMAAHMLARDQVAPGKQVIALAALSGLTVAARYESVALVGMIALVAASRRQWLLVAAALLPAAAVLVGFGSIWVANGGWWVPNSFLLKTEMGMGMQEQGLFTRLSQHLMSIALHPIGAMMIAMCAAMAGLMVVLWVLKRRMSSEWVLLLLGLGCTVAQLLFGKVGWLFRYEAWLIAIDGLAILLACQALLEGRRRWYGVVLLALLAIGVPRAVHAFDRTTKAPHDREWEHFGMTHALDAYAGETVLVNDIGVIAYYGVPRSIDIFGLADNVSLQMKLAKDIGPRQIAAFAEREGAKLAVLQLCWPELGQRLPEGWQLVEAWTGPRNVIFHDLTLGFLARDGETAARMSRELAKASKPSNVRRFDARSDLVRAYNATAEKNVAVANLCNAGSMLVTGQPDPAYSHYLPNIKRRPN